LITSSSNNTAKQACTLLTLKPVGLSGPSSYCSGGTNSLLHTVYTTFDLSCSSWAAPLGGLLTLKPASQSGPSSAGSKSLLQNMKTLICAAAAGLRPAHLEACELEWAQLHWHNSLLHSVQISNTLGCDAHLEACELEWAQLVLLQGYKQPAAQHDKFKPLSVLQQLAAPHPL
jgi:hypothetical protein